MRADLVLEGGGVRGIGLVGAMLVLDEAGYDFPRIAGTSSGAIVASVAVALRQAGRSLTPLRDYLGTVDYPRFEDKSLIRRLSGEVGSAAHLLLDMACTPATIWPSGCPRSSPISGSPPSDSW